MIESGDAYLCSYKLQTLVKSNIPASDGLKKKKENSHKEILVNLTKLHFYKFSHTRAHNTDTIIEGKLFHIRTYGSALVAKTRRKRSLCGFYGQFSDAK